MAYVKTGEGRTEETEAVLSVVGCMFVLYVCGDERYRTMYMICTFRRTTRGVGVKARFMRLVLKSLGGSRLT